MNDTVYIPGLPAGKKLENISANPDVCFTVYEMKGLLYDPEEKPRDTNAEYVSAAIQGRRNDNESKKRYCMRLYASIRLILHKKIYLIIC